MVKFQLKIRYGANDYGKINVEIRNTDNENIKEIFNKEFKGLYFNDLSGEYWTYDIPMNDKSLQFINYDTETDTIIFECVDNIVLQYVNNQN